VLMGAHHTEEDTVKHIATAVALAGAFCAYLASQTYAQQHADHHVMLAPSELTWTDLPALPGVKIAVIEGPLTGTVPIMFRLKFPANYKVPPHWHPGIEHVTIISGTLNMGMGDTFDMTKTRALTPWGVTYVNPADDPAKK
jgi:hypothetical protein